MSHFFSYISRMKLIDRWSLMRGTQTENVQEHSLQVAVIAHALAVIKNKFYEGDVNPERVALLAIYHDASEVITGDLPTPVKYFSDSLKSAFRDIENHALEKLMTFLPADLQPEYESLLFVKEEEKEHWALVKAADTLSAYIKCLEEETAGNREFRQAKRSIEDKLGEMDRPEVHYFMRKFIPSFTLTLDELSRGEN